MRCTNLSVHGKTTFPQTMKMTSTNSNKITVHCICFLHIRRIFIANSCLVTSDNLASLDSATLTQYYQGPPLANCGCTNQTHGC